ncbi:hypothetical protein BBJ28_00020493 [Nothophytophthora sp. Chile5]|nr:hypothetical protein BBJ28_00020493 [Nothophytophthora sp. Chile5]
MSCAHAVSAEATTSPNYRVDSAAASALLASTGAQDQVEWPATARLRAADNKTTTADDPKAKKLRFFFSTAADLALLKEVGNLRPYSAGHGNKGQLYETVAANMSESFNAALTARMVKEHLVSEFKAEDQSFRKKSGIEETYMEHKQLTDIVSQVNEIQETKSTSKARAQDKADRLLSYGEVQRNQATKRRCQRLVGSPANAVATPAGTMAEKAAPIGKAQSTPAAVTPAPAGTSVPQTRQRVSTPGKSRGNQNATIASYFEFQMQYRDEKAQQARMLHIKRAKIKRATSRWTEELEFKMAKAAAEETKWVGEMAIRRDEAAIRRDEIELRMQELAC